MAEIQVVMYTSEILRVAKCFAEIERGDIIKQTDFCLAFFEVLTEMERNEEVDVAFAKFVCALGCPLLNCLLQE